MKAKDLLALPVLSTVLVLSHLAGGCASHKSTGNVPLITDDSAATWQNAGVTPPPSPAAPAPQAPPNTLKPSIATVGGSVSTKPTYAQYDFGWPRIFTSAASTNTLYEPQVESWEGMVLQARAAVSILEPGMRDPTFGILKLKALTHVDKVERLVHFEDIQITDAIFPSSPAKKDEYSKLWLALIKEHVRSVSLDHISASLALSGAEKKAQAMPILNPVPEFIFSTTPAMLIQVQRIPDSFQS